MGEAAAEKPAARPAQAPAEPPREAQRELDAARALAASVPPGDALEADPREVAGLAALGAGDAQGAGKGRTAPARRKPRRRDRGAEERLDQAPLRLGRLASRGGHGGA